MCNDIKKLQWRSIVVMTLSMQSNVTKYRTEDGGIFHSNFITISSILINFGFTSVDNHFLRVKILTITLSVMLYLYNSNSA